MSPLSSRRRYGPHHASSTRVHGRTGSLQRSGGPGVRTINRLPHLRSRATAGGSGGCRAALAMRQLTPGLILSSLGTAGLLPSISFSTSCRELTLWRHRSPRPSDLRRKSGNGPLDQSQKSNVGKSQPLCGALHHTSPLPLAVLVVGEVIAARRPPTASARVASRIRMVGTV